MSSGDKRIDWDEVRRRVRDSQQALEKALAADEQRLEGVYRERAAQLAGRRAQAGGPSTALRVLVFLLGEERYGVPFGDLVELLPFGSCTPVPGGPPQLLGVMNIHGEIRSVTDLARLLELPAGEAATGGYVLLLRKPGGQVALRVDQLEGIQSVAPADIATLGDGEGGTALRFVKGLTPGKIRLLSTEALLSHSLLSRGQ